MSATRVRVSRNGRVLIPAAVRHRWGTAAVLVIDRGDYAIIRPVPDDPIGSLRGAHAGPGGTSEDARSADRVAETSSEEHRP
jgi:AbrB family looped-hinge helix DNA binding protein